MSYELVQTNISTTSGQSFTTQTFAVSKIRGWVRALTGIPDLVINQFLNEVIADFCKQTWLLQKNIEIGDVLQSTVMGGDDFTEWGEDDYTAWGVGSFPIDASAGLYSVYVDLEDYLDGLVVHDINQVIVNNKPNHVTKNAFVGDLTTYSSGYKSGYHYDIVTENVINVWPLNLKEDTIQVPVILKTSDTATVIPYLLDEYYKEIASGVIAQVRVMPRYKDEDVLYHANNYQKGISAGKHKYSKQYKEKIISSPRFAI
jgi:hypothetical protein